MRRPTARVRLRFNGDEFAAIERLAARRGQSTQRLATALIKSGLALEEGRGLEALGVALEGVSEQLSSLELEIRRTEIEQTERFADAMELLRKTALQQLEALLFLRLLAFRMYPKEYQSVVDEAAKQTPDLLRRSSANGDLKGTPLEPQPVRTGVSA